MIAALLAPLLLASPDAAAAQNEPWMCRSLDSCLRLLASSAPQSRGVSDQGKEVARAIQRYGRAAVPGLLAMLESSDYGAREAAAYTLRDLDALTEAEVEPLLRALRRGEEWVAPALARIGSRAAIDGLFDALSAHPENYSQVTFAFQKLGRKGVPTLLAAFDCRRTCNERLLEAIKEIFEEMGTEARDAVAPLTKIASSRDRPMAARRAAVAALGAIGEAAAPAAPALQRLARTERDSFGAPVEEALAGMKVPAAGEALAAKLEAKPDVQLMVALAQLGPSGQAAGPALVRLLDQQDRHLHVAAARALGYVGYRASIPRLVAALGNPQDWQLVLAAAESLGRIRDASALPALDAVARAHWYPPVREAARKAQAVIGGRESYTSRWHPKNFGLEFFEYEHAGREVAACEARDGRHLPLFLPADDVARARAAVGTYAASVVSYGAGADGSPQRSETFIQQEPEAALRVPDGWLLGASRGEWGGELVFVGGGGQELVVDDNIRSLAQLGTRIVALGGLAHLMTNRGLAYEVTKAPGGQWTARPWRVLPGEPTGSSLERDGRWLIHTRGGSVLLAPDGTLSMATCRPPK